MRLRRHPAALGAAAVVAALTLTACGSSSKTSSGPVKRTVSASVMADAANKAAAQAGYAFSFSFAGSGQKLKGASSASGAGNLQAKALIGKLTMTVGLPTGLGSEAALLGTLRTELLLTGHDRLYVQVPAGLVKPLGGKQWLGATPAELVAMIGRPSLATKVVSTTPSEAFRMLAQASTGQATDLGSSTVGGHQVTHYREVLKDAGGTNVTLEMWIGADGLPYRLAAGAAETGAHVAITIDLTAFGAQPAPAIPAPSTTGSLAALLKEISSFS